MYGASGWGGKGNGGPCKASGDRVKSPKRIWRFGSCRIELLISHNPDVGEQDGESDLCPLIIFREE